MIPTPMHSFSLPGLDIKMVFRPLSTPLYMLVHPKDPVPLEQQKRVVYSIPCNKCPKMYNTLDGLTELLNID